ncbi:MAG: NAD+ synthase [Candidatus Altiarchaeales archaeon]|nr:NAD+ synthase [Candidatus Altiarchaeales archaeon]
MILTLAQLDFTVGDLEGNTQKILSTLEEQRRLIGSEGVETVCIAFPELALCGYPPLDLLDNQSFIEQQLDALQEVCRATFGLLHVYVFLGYVEKNSGAGKALHNSVAVCHNGQVIYNYRKRLLPTYDVFDEDRYFEPGKEAGIVTIEGWRIGLLVCEDIWVTNRYNVDPPAELRKTQVDVILSLNASPSSVGKLEARITRAEEIVQRQSAPLFYLNQVGGNDELVFDGNTFVSSEWGRQYHAQTHVTGDAFKEGVYSFRLDKKLIPNWGVCTTWHVVRDIHKKSPLTLIDKENPKRDFGAFFYDQAVCGVRDYMRKCGFKKAVIGSSGGIDSAVTMAIAVEAVGAENVIAITMPSEYSSVGSVDDSAVLCSNLGIENFKTIPIRDQFQGFMDTFNEHMGDEEAGVTEQNVQARIRGQILMAVSNRTGALVLSTGNKSELSVGYCTIYGDMCGGLAPISDCYKMEVYEIARYVNRKAQGEVIPVSIIDKAPSAELAPGQKDTDNLPPYEILDYVLKYLIEGYVSVNLHVGMKRAPKKTRALLEKIHGMLMRTEFKRRQAAIGLKMHDKAFGQGRRYPIASKVKLGGF